MERKTSIHPAWALAFKRKGTELRLLRGTYYLYAVSSRWDKEKKRSVKITGKLLGKITEQDGFVESDKARIAKQQMKIAHLQVKEYGVTALIGSVFHDIVWALQQHFPDIWKEIVCLSYGRLMHRSSLKNMQHHYACSYLSEQYSGLDLSAKRLSGFLRSLGQERSRIVAFCRSFRLEDDCILFDGTDLFSHSERLDLPKFGRTKFGTYDEIINMMCMYSVEQQIPVYYRLLPGNIKDTVSFRLCLKESGAKNAIVIIDKGFASKKNIESLESVPLRYIIPLPRNSAMIDYQKSKPGNKNLFDGYFMYHKRYIWHYAQPIDKQKRVILFLDEELRNREEKDYLNRIESKARDYTIDKFYAKQHVFGTIAIIDNTAMQPEDIYVRYKTRGQVEIMIDAFKNVLAADRTYMQNPQALEGWMFLNLIALKWYYALLKLLKQHELNRKYSPEDFLNFLAEVKKVKINDLWHDAECIRKTSDLLDKIGLKPIT